MKKGILDVGDEYLGHLKYDKKLYQAIREFRIRWSQKDSIYIEFLGGNLTGVHPIRFSNVDEDMFFIDLLNVDQNTLRNEFYKLDDIDKTRKVTSNVTYLTLMYLIHKFMRSSDIGKDKENAIRELYYIFAYKVISSLISHYFSHSLDASVAKMVYERLSNRFLIKKLGTWQKVVEYRASDVLPAGLHYTKLYQLDTLETTKVIADLQGRIREIIKNIYVEMIEVIQRNEKIYSSTMEVVDDEGTSVREISGTHDQYIRYIHGIIKSPNDFIVDDLIYLIGAIVPNVDSEKLVDTLKYISKHANVLQNSKDDFVQVSIVTTINYMRTKGIVNNYDKHMYEILSRMKGYWSSSSVKDEEIKHIKEYLYNLTQKATGNKTKWLLATVSISVLLYIFVRAVYRK